MKALLVHSGALGDFILSLRIVAALRDEGASVVAVLGRSAVASIAVGRAGVDGVLDIDSGGWHLLFSPGVEIPLKCSAKLTEFDLIVNMSAQGGDGVLSKRLSEISGGKVMTIDPRPHKDWTGHISDQWLADLREQGLNGAAGVPRLALDESERGAARRRLEVHGAARVVLIHPGSGGVNKCWPIENYLELAHCLRAKGEQVVFLIGPVEEEAWSPGKVSRLEAAAKVFRGNTLIQVAALAAASDLVIGNDSGVSHLAAAAGAHTLTLFGPTNPVFWRPLGPRARVMGGAGLWPDVDSVLRAC